MNRWKRSVPVLVVFGALAMIGVTHADAATGFRSGQQMDVALADGAPGTWTQAVTVGTPFSSGQTIAVQVPANGVLPARADLTIAECTAPNGVPPKSPTSCDTLTAVHAPNGASADGSFTYSGYVVHALPGAGATGSTGPSAVTCGAALATECVLYVGTGLGDFGLPHFWSQGFAVTANAGDLGINPGDGTPPRSPTSLDALVAASLAATAQQPTIHTTCSIGAQPHSSCAINQTISVTVTTTCPGDGATGPDCGGSGGGGTGGGGTGGGGTGGGGGGTEGGGGGAVGGGGGGGGEVHGSSALPFTEGTAGSASSGGPGGVLAFTGSDPGTLVVLGAVALVVGWLLQRRRSGARRRVAD